MAVLKVDKPANGLPGEGRFPAVKAHANNLSALMHRFYSGKNHVIDPFHGTHL